jgi:hypothetical protein
MSAQENPSTVKLSAEQQAADLSMRILHDSMLRHCRRGRMLLARRLFHFAFWKNVHCLYRDCGFL